MSDLDQINVTAEQIELMKHTIGYVHGEAKRGKYKAYRNYFAAGRYMPEFEDLVKKELVLRQVKDEYVFYFLSHSGIQLLSKILGIKIIWDFS